ncbi:MAG: DUF4180 domain-containing protein [Flavobacteriales bacterium]
MEIITHHVNNQKLAEIKSNKVIVKNHEDSLQILGDMYYSGYDGIILYSESLTPQFFDLKTGFAGEMLQKFSTYRLKLFIIGQFDLTSSESLKAFIIESNNGNLINFNPTLEDLINSTNLN